MSKDLLSDYGDVLTVEDIMKILKIGRNKAYSLLKDGKIKSIRIGTMHRIPKNSLIMFLENSCRSIENQRL